MEQANTEELKKNILVRMRKIEGQTRGIQRMIEDGEKCEQIMVQMRAVRSALKSTNTMILTRYLHRCFERIGDGDDKDATIEALEETVRVLSGYLES
jgi:DNA-binding FrmR family transcriptional regulator